MRGPSSQRRLSGRAARSRAQSWPLGSETPERRVTRESLFAFLVAAVCAVGAVAGGSIAERVLLACASLGIAVFGARKFAERHRAAKETGYVVLDERGVARKQSGKNTILADWKAPFGVSLFASKSGDRGLIAFTSDGATRYLGVHVSADEDSVAATLFDRSAIRADDDALFTQSVDQSLRAKSAAALLAAVESREPEATSRVFLTSIRGEAVVVAVVRSGREKDHVVGVGGQLLRYLIPLRLLDLIAPRRAALGVGAALVGLVDDDQVPAFAPDPLTDVILLRVVEGGDHLCGAVPGID